MKQRPQEPEFTVPDFVKLIREGDPAAMETLVDHYTDHLFRGALALGFSSDDARDLVQAVWVAFMEARARFEGRSHVRTFLFGILYNKARTLRRDQREDAVHDPIDSVVEKRFDANGHWIKPPVDPERFLGASQTMGLIKDCIDRLPLNQRLAFCLREIDEHGTEDICEILKVSVSNLGVLMFRARNRLRECIEQKAREGAS
jgi:RNA polymerase sigma-70 factor (ECF subfamily)